MSDNISYSIVDATGKVIQTDAELRRKYRLFVSRTRHQLSWALAVEDDSIPSLYSFIRTNFDIGYSSTGARIVVGFKY